MHSYTLTKFKGFFMKRRLSILLVSLLLSSTATLFADPVVDSLMKASAFKETIFFINKTYPEASRTADVWIAQATALSKIGAAKEEISKAYSTASKAYPDNPDLQEIEAIVTNPQTDFAMQIPHGDGQTILREILLVADHNAYHIGEFAILRQGMGTWPKGRDA